MGRKLLAGVLCLAIPELARADLINTALASFRDSAGILQTVTSNTVTVQVVVPSVALLPPPDLSEFDQKDVGLHDTLSVQQYPVSVTGFNWEFASQSSGGAGSAGSAAVDAGGEARVGTQAPSLSLSGLILALGTYRVRVQAVNGTQTSAWSEAMVTLVSADLETARVHPNPFRSDHGDTTMVFDQLPIHSTVKIFTVSGHLVAMLHAPNGSVSWDLKNESGDTVASGIYVYLATDGQGAKARGKFAVIR